MNRRPPPARAKRGKFTVALHDSGYVGLPLVSLPLETVQSTAVSLRVVSPGTSEKELLATELLRSGCPTATSAAAAFTDGIAFQMSTRLKPRSATKRCTPSEVTPTGFSRVVAEAVVLCCVRSGSTNAVKLGWPKTTSAATPLVVGIRL